MNSDRTLFQARIIALALVGGVVVVAGVALLLVDGEPPGVLDPGSGRLLFLGWAALSVIWVGAWYALWRRAKRIITPVRGSREIHGEELGRGRVLPSLILAWAFLEAVAMTGAIVYLLTARLSALIGGLLVMAFGIALSFPREEWFSRRRWRFEESDRI